MAAVLCEKPITELKTAEYNPRVVLGPGMPEWEKLKTSIETFGAVEPVVWNKRTGNVVGGHQRLEVMKALGYKKVPCSVVDLDPEEEKILNVALNKIKGRWDHDKLEALLSEFDREVATVTGFSEDELAVILADGDDLEGEFWNDDEWSDEDLYGASWVVTLVFENADYAKEWLEDNGYDLTVRDGSASAVLRMEEDGEQ